MVAPAGWVGSISDMTPPRVSDDFIVAGYRVQILVLHGHQRQILANMPADYAV